MTARDSAESASGSWPRAYAYGDLDPDYMDDALVRAGAKIESLLEGRGLGEPAGRLIGRLIATVLFVVLPGIGALVGAVALSLERRPVWAAVVALAIAGLLLLYWAWRLYLGSKPDTPARALRLYYRSLGAGKTKRALRYVVPADQDAFPRYQPDVSGLGRPSKAPYRFDSFASFREYWNRLLRYHTAPYCRAFVKQIRVRTIGDDLAVVRFRLSLQMNTSLWMFLVIVALILAAIIDLATRKTAATDLEKILVRVGDEWHLYDGSWQGVEEEDATWLQATS